MMEEIESTDIDPKAILTKKVLTEEGLLALQAYQRK